MPSRHLDIAIERLPQKISPSFFKPRKDDPSSSLSSSSSSSFPFPSHYATPASARAAVKKVRYAEIDVSLYDNPRLKPHKEEVDGAKEEGEEVVMEEGGEVEASGSVRRQRNEMEMQQERGTMPHERLLLYVGQEWKELVTEVCIKTL